MIPIDPFKYNKPNGLDLKMIVKDSDKAIRNIFKQDIKGNFLIKIFHDVFDIIKFDLNNYYPLNNSLENAMVGSIDNFQVDIGKIIVGLHKSNMIFLDDVEKAKKQSNMSYQKQLANEVVENIKLRKYGSSFFRKKQIIYGDRFIYFHLPYDLFVICIRINELLIKNLDTKYYSFFSKISNIGLSVLSLLEDSFLDNAYPLCRSIIELYIELVMVIDNPIIQKKYNYLSGIEFRKSCCGIDYPDDFLRLYEKRVNQNENKKNMFLHFGWVDDIKNYHNLVRKNPYSVGGLIEYLKKTNKDIDYELYERFYKQCHSYSHGNIIGVRYPLLSYFEISIMLYLTVFHSYLILCEILNIDTKIEEIDIKSKTIRDYELLLKQYNIRKTENFDNYYKHQFEE